VSVRATATPPGDDYYRDQEHLNEHRHGRVPLRLFLAVALDDGGDVGRSMP